MFCCLCRRQNGVFLSMGVTQIVLWSCIKKLLQNRINQTNSIFCLFAGLGKENNRFQYLNSIDLEGYVARTLHFP